MSIFPEDREGMIRDRDGDWIPDPTLTKPEPATHPPGCRRGWLPQRADETVVPCPVCKPHLIERARERAELAQLQALATPRPRLAGPSKTQAAEHLPLHITDQTTENPMTTQQNTPTSNDPLTVRFQRRDFPGLLAAQLLEEADSLDDAALIAAPEIVAGDDPRVGSVKLARDLATALDLRRAAAALDKVSEPAPAARDPRSLVCVSLDIDERLAEVVVRALDARAENLRGTASTAAHRALDEQRERKTDPRKAALAVTRSLALAVDLKTGAAAIREAASSTQRAGRSQG